MGKGHRHQKNVKSERAKVKLKSKTKNLPKGLNVTDTSFKVKKILIREQLKTRDATEILSRRKLNIKDLITRLHHYNSSVRQEAVKELKDILAQHSSRILSSQLNSLLQGIAALSLDKEKNVRRDSLKALNLILNPISNDQIQPFFGILISYLSCAMTHIDPNIKEDSLLFLDVLSDNCGSLLAKSSEKILPNFLDMISKLRTESRPERQLTTTLSSKQTSMRWRVKVLSRLSNILTSMIGVKKSQRVADEISSSSPSKVINVGGQTTYVSLLRPNRLKLSEINLNKDENPDRQISGDFGKEELKRFVEVLMPLMIESWIEVVPKEHEKGNQSNFAISNEAARLLNSIMRIMEVLTDYVDLFEVEWGSRTMSVWFDATFRKTFTRTIIKNFPYCETKTIIKFKKHQEDFHESNTSIKCLEQNLAICRVYVWHTAVNFSHGGIESVKEKCLQVLQYLNAVIKNWSNADNFALPQLTKCIKSLLIGASKVWYRNKVYLGSLLETIIDVYSRHAKQELRSQLFGILTEIVTNHDLIELHGDDSFIKFIGSMPNLLLKHSIHDNTIKMLNRIVLQHRKWIESSLREKHQQIIANAEKIQIICTDDETRSRLMICNLFYFIDGQIYY